MNTLRERALTQFPTVLLTLISIIQALALELMWSKIVESDFLWDGTLQSLIAWGMLSVVFLGILQIWVMYSTMVMGFIWQPSLRDSLFPFIIGIQEFMLISLIDEEFRGLWLFVLASIVVTANWIMHISMRRARQHPANMQFFETVLPATLRDFYPAIGIVVLFVVLGVLVNFTGNRNWLPLFGIIAANIILIVQINAARRLWRNLMSLSIRVTIADNIQAGSIEGE